MAAILVTGKTPAELAALAEAINAYAGETYTIVPDCVFSEYGQQWLGVPDGFPGATEPKPSIWVLALTPQGPLLMPVPPGAYVDDTTEATYTDAPGYLLLQLLDRYPQLDRPSLVAFGQQAGILPPAGTVWRFQSQGGAFTAPVAAQGTLPAEPGWYQVEHPADVAIRASHLDATAIIDFYRNRPWL